jgi:hypothetical protein
MRVGLIISVIIHVAVFLWIMVAPGEKPFDPAHADPIFVDLVSPKEVPQLAEPEPVKPETAKSEVPAFEPSKPEPKLASLKPALPKATPRKPEPPKPELPKPEPPKPVLAADPRPSPKPAPKTAAAPSVEDQAAAASRFARMLNLPTAPLTGSGSGGGLPSENRSKLSGDDIAKFKAQVSKCWVAPDDVPSGPGFNVLIRVALKPDGALGAEPALVLAPASMAGPLLVESAKQALAQCQPYNFLPADKYQDWKVLELGFSVDGPSDDFRIPALDAQ